MRYRNWDILLFPGHSKVPIEEFQTSCSIVPDPDSTAHHGSGEVDNVTPALMPLMTTFIPSQPAGTPFRLSLHSWDPPPSAAQGQSFSTAPEIPKFEVLLRVDGKFVTARVYVGDGSAPLKMDKTFATTLSADKCPLKFPEFDLDAWKESVSLNVTGPGRISIYIAELFGGVGSYERGPNIVGFSFRYAPLELLELMGIAWPPPAIWPQMAAFSVQAQTASGSALDVIQPSCMLPDPSTAHVGPWPLDSFPDLSTAPLDNGAPPPAMPLQLPDPFVENVGDGGPMMPYVPDVGGNDVGFMEAIASASRDQPGTQVSVQNPTDDNFPSHPSDFQLLLEPLMLLGGLECNAEPESGALDPSACDSGNVGSLGGSVLQDTAPPEPSQGGSALQASTPPKPSQGGSDEARTSDADMKTQASGPRSESAPVREKRIYRRKAAVANQRGMKKRSGSVKVEPEPPIGRRALADGTGSPTITGRKRARPRDLASDKPPQPKRKRGRPKGSLSAVKSEAASPGASQAVDSKPVSTSPPTKNESKDDVLTDSRLSATV